MNKLQRAINGNINKNLKILTWNKGNALIKNAMVEIKDLIDKYKPDILVINELRLQKDDDISVAFVRGYRLEVDNLRENYKESRTGIYIKENLIYERVPQYEANLSSTVCIKVGFKKTRKIYICGFYRQFTINHQDDFLKIKSQSKIECDRRFELQTNLWEKLLNDKKHNEIFFCGDFNYCTIQQRKPENEKSDYDKSQNKINNMINSKLIQNGARQGRCIDHILTTRPDKMFKLEQINLTESDHSLLIYHRFMNILQAEETFFLTRDYRKIDFSLVNERIINEKKIFNSITRN